MNDALSVRGGNKVTVPPYNLGRILHESEVQPLDNASLSQMADLVIAEVLRQERLAREGKFNNTHILPSGPDIARLAVVAEEYGEVAHEVTDNIMKPERARRPLQNELIQLAACALAWATAIFDGR